MGLVDALRPRFGDGQPLSVHGVISADWNASLRAMSVLLVNASRKSCMSNACRSGVALCFMLVLEGISSGFWIPVAKLVLENNSLRCSLLCAMSAPEVFPVRVLMGKVFSLGNLSWQATSCDKPFREE